MQHDDLRRTVLDGLRSATGQSQQRPTLLLENLEHLAVPYQGQMVSLLRQNAIPARVVATMAAAPSDRRTNYTSDAARHGAVDAALLDAVSTVAIQIPPLVDRMEDLPILAQCFLEACNRDNQKQVGSIRPESLDLLALHRWPRELDELREVLAAAHRACKTHEIAPSDLPPVIQHAVQAASHAPRQPERVVLDELLATIEREVVIRALAQAGGNKSAAAELLGMTRPRLYRRMIQLELVSESAPEVLPGPEFIEHDPVDEAP
jgi:DNA-binding NtrC family response regulator